LYYLPYSIVLRRLGYSVCLKSTTFFINLRKDDIGDYDNCKTLNEDKIVLLWTINGDYVNFTLVGKTKGWVAIGINQDGDASVNT
jgi:hypothetical protein